jgi:hypothetical protein
MIWRAPFACTVTNIRGYRIGGTGATVNAGIGNSGTTGGVGYFQSSDLSLTNTDTGTWNTAAANQNTAVASGDGILVKVVSITGTPSQIVIQVDFTRP